MSTVLKDNAFNQEQLLQYFEFQQEFEDLITLMDKFTDLMDYYLPYQLDFVLLGLPAEEQVKIEGEEEESDIYEQYNDLNEKLRNRKLDPESFITQAKELILDFKSLA